LTTATADPAADVHINSPQPLAELQHAFDLYEDALIHNKVNVLDTLFWNSPHTLRYGAKENLNGYDEIKAFRAGRPNVGLTREVLDRHFVAFNDCMGVANITFRRNGEPRVGRQSQTWVKLPGGSSADFAGGWRVVSAHVSWMDM
jgi:Protein of unknown function (DUF3225)